MMKKVFAAVISLCCVYQADAMLLIRARMLNGTSRSRIAQSMAYSTRRSSIWVGAENVSDDNIDLFNHLHAKAYEKDRTRLDAWVAIGRVEDSIKKSGEFSQEEIEKFVDLHNKAQSMSKDIRNLNKQIDGLYEPEKRLLELEKEQERIKGLIVTTLQKDAASRSEGLRRSFELEAHNQYLHSLKDKLAYIVNERRRLEGLLSK